MDFLNPYTVVDIPIFELMFNLALGLIIAVIWAVVIGKSTRLVVDTRQYLPIFLLLIPSMILIITIIKSSIALSLGLVGALSIVRFRTPIKEPEELLYLFVAIAVGLGLGANQPLPTLIGFLTIVLVISPFAFGNFRARRSRNNLIDMVITDESGSPPDASTVEKLIREYDPKFIVKRVTTTSHRLEMLIETSRIDLDAFTDIHKALTREGNEVEISIMDNARVIT